MASDQPPFSFRARVWVWPGPAAWHFVHVPKRMSADIRQLFHGLGRGFGSLPVVVTLGSTCWRTSIFPDSKAGAYLLPLKAEVRRRENIRNGSTVRIEFSIQP